MGLHGAAHVGIGCYSRWVPGSVGMAMPGVLLAQSLKSITCFWRTFHMKGALAVLVNKRYLEHVGHFRLIYKRGLGFA